METPTYVPALPTLEEFLETPIGRKVPPVTRLIASKLESGDAPGKIARALGIPIETVNRHINIIQCFPCRSLDEKLLEAEQEDEDLKRFAAVLHRAVATYHGPPIHPDNSDRPMVDRGKASQRAKVLGYLDSPASGKLSADARKQLRMWAEGASQKEVGRKLGVDQGNLSRRIKAAVNEVYRVESAIAQIEKETGEARQEEAQENQRREEVLRKAVAAGDEKQINKLLSNYPRSSDAIARASTGGKSHERWTIASDDVPARWLGPVGAGTDK